MKVDIPTLDCGRLPVRHAADGDGGSPPIRWSGVPDAARELAVLMQAVNADDEPVFTHWVAWGIDPARRQLDGGLKGKPDPDVPEGMVQGTGDQDSAGYQPPVGVLNRPQDLCLRVLALDTTLELGPGTPVSQFEQAISGHVIDEGEVRFQYVRPG